MGLHFLLLILLVSCIEGFYPSVRTRKNSRFSTAGKDSGTLISDTSTITMQNNQLKVIEIRNDTIDIYRDLVIDSCIFAINTFFNSKSTEISDSIVTKTLQWVQNGTKYFYIRRLVSNFHRVRQYSLPCLVITIIIIICKECLGRLAVSSSRLLVLADSDESRIFAIVELFLSQYYPSNSDEPPLPIFKIANLIVDKSVRRRGELTHVIADRMIH